MILTENLCKLIFNLAWDSTCSSGKHHGFIHVEIPACTYAYHNQFPLSVPHFCLPLGRPSKLLCRASADSIKSASLFHCSDSLLPSFFAGTKHSHSYKAMVSNYCKALGFFFPFLFYYAFVLS